jgi:hypothetical protein
MATVAEQFWKEILDVRQPLEPVRPSHSKRIPAVLVRRSVRRGPHAEAIRPNPTR